MLKILWARLQQYVNHELPDVQAGFRKGRGTRDQIANIRWIIEKAREFQKNIYLYFCSEWLIPIFNSKLSCCQRFQEAVLLISLLSKHPICLAAIIPRVPLMEIIMICNNSLYLSHLYKFIVPYICLPPRLLDITFFNSIQSLSHVWPFATPWTAAHSRYVVDTQ